MKWVKHMTNSRRDPKMLALKREMGFAGIGMYWAVVEAVAEQYDAKGKPELEMDLASWREITGIPPQSLKKLCKKVEETSKKLGKTPLFLSSFSEKTLKIHFPKIKDIKDNHTSNLQAACKQELEEEKEEEKKEEERGVNAGAPVDPPLEESPPDPPQQSGPKKTDCPSKGRPSRQGFMACWQIYPLKQGEEDAWREWCRLEDNGTLEESWAIREKILIMTQEDDRWKRGFAPKFAKWLNGKCWMDQPYKKPIVDNGGQPPRANNEAQRVSQSHSRMAQLLNQQNQGGQHGQYATGPGESGHFVEGDPRTRGELPCGEGG